MAPSQLARPLDWSRWSMAAMRGVSMAAVLLATAATLGGCGAIPGNRPKAEAAPTIGVNAYLWRATLDTLSFMPLASADPWGGTVISDWYSNPEQPNERFKVTVYILDTRLRADGLKVTVNKQVAGPAGQWADAAAADQTEIDLQNAILTRARQLRLSSAGDRG
jgi:uncharacterized protein DUF3576